MHHHEVWLVMVKWMRQLLIIPPHSLPAMKLCMLAILHHQMGPPKFFFLPTCWFTPSANPRQPWSQYSAVFVLKNCSNVLNYSDKFSVEFRRNSQIIIEMVTCTSLLRLGHGQGLRRPTPPAFNPNRTND